MQMYRAISHVELSFLAACLGLILLVRGDHCVRRLCIELSLKRRGNLVDKCFMSIIM